jgi:hypothetical protein
MWIRKGLAPLLLCAVAATGIGLPVEAADIRVQTKKFANCSELTKVYPGGVAKSAKATNKGGATKNKPTVNAAVYKANQGKDRDKDGIACEN